jgi:hypothetical protein
MFRAILPPKVVRRDAVWAIHMLSAAVLLTHWGIWLMLPFDTFGACAGCRTMQVIAPEPIWGAAFSLVGVLLYVGSVLGHSRVQVVASGLAALAFALIASSLAWSNLYSGGWLTFTVPAIANYWALKRLVC